LGEQYWRWGGGYYVLVTCNHFPLKCLITAFSNRETQLQPQALGPGPPGCQGSPTHCGLTLRGTHGLHPEPFTSLSPYSKLHSTGFSTWTGARVQFTRAGRDRGLLAQHWCRCHVASHSIPDIRIWSSYKQLNNQSEFLKQADTVHWVQGLPQQKTESLPWGPLTSVNRRKWPSRVIVHWGTDG
jgi:hypothetical protein